MRNERKINTRRLKERGQEHATCIRKMRSGSKILIRSTELKLAFRSCRCTITLKLVFHNHGVRVWTTVVWTGTEASFRLL